MYLKFFINKCIGIYELDPAHFLSAPGLTWQACFKKTGVKLKSLTNNYKLMLIEKGVRGGICHAIYRYAKVSNKYLKTYNKKLNYYIPYIHMQAICMDGKCCKYYL